jgi:hypothetical protein
MPTRCSFFFVLAKIINRANRAALARGKEKNYSRDVMILLLFDFLTDLVSYVAYILSSF